MPTPDSVDYPQARLVSDYDTLNRSLQTLAQMIRQSPLPLWLPLTDAEQCAGADAREKAVQLYCDIWYRDGQDGRSTRSCHGLVAATPAILDAADEANRAKQAFRQAVMAIRQQAPDNHWLALLHQRRSDLRRDLNSKGLGRLHLKQCYRQIPVVRQHPARVGFNWYSSGRSIRRLSVEEVSEKLLKMGLDKPHVQLQYERLTHLPPSAPLAQVQQQAPLMRANLRFDHDDAASERNAMNLSLPLLFLWQPGQAFPEHNQPPLQAPALRQRQLRSDCKIEQQPFLPSLRIHRYRD